MDNSRLGLQVIQIAEPCTQPWNEMAGGGASRFCGHCQKSVVNLSTMNLDDAQKLICQTGGSLCVRFQQAADGSVMTLDYQQKPGRKRWFRPAIFTAALAVTGSVFASAAWFRKPAPPPAMMMGAIAPSSVLPSAQPTPACGANEPASLSP